MPYNVMTRSILYMRGCKDDLSKGECYENGRYVKQDNAAAILCYQKAAQQGKVVAYHKLGCFYLKNNNIVASLFNYWMGAMLGHQESRTVLEDTRNNIMAIYYMGRVYEHEKNWAKAQEYYKEAIKSENASAMYRMGVLYRQDRLSDEATDPVISADKSTELNWYRKAAVSGSKHALEDLLQASKSEADAAFHLAEIYISRDGGMARNMVQAIQYFHQASQLGSAKADFQLGLIYEIGEENIEKNLFKASIHYIRAAEKNNNIALTNLKRLANHENANNELAHELGLLYWQRKDKITALSWFKKAADQGCKKSSAMLKQMAEEDPLFSYAVGQAYEKDSNDIKQACFYYTIAMLSKHEETEHHLFSLANKGKKEAQYAIAYNYYHHKKDFANAAYWCMKAAEANHQEAHHYLENTLFSAELCFSIAEKYEKGDNVLKNLHRSIAFYQRASQMEDKNATFHLGQIYETGDTSVPIDHRMAFDYYLLAVKRKHENALKSLESLLERLANVEMEFELATFYEKFLEDNARALYWYKRSADKGKNEVTKYLKKWASQNADIAFAIGDSYEKDTTCPDCLTKAISYYSIALIRKDRKSVDRIFSLAEKGNAEAQYILGAKYYMLENNFRQAVYWCMQAAEHNHVQAFSYLKETLFNQEIYITLAESYEQGKQVKRNIELAIEFYIKAENIGNKAASFHLGQLYETGAEDLLQDINKAYHYYLISFKKGFEPALKNLETLAEKQKNTQWYYEVGMLHKEILKNQMSSIYWHKKASDAGYAEASNALEKLSNSNPDFAYAIAQAYDYEEELVSDNNLTTTDKSDKINNTKVRAYAYYVKAALNGKEEALKYLEKLALSGNKIAQYSLGHQYYLSISNIDKAMDWCLLAADQDYKPAQEYLTNTNFNASEYFLIAEKLEDGKDFKKNIPRALQYYEKACFLNNIEATLYLGYFYQIDHDEVGIQKDNDKACGYLIKAALQGSADALISIECLGNDVSPVMQDKISQMYGQHPVKNSFKEAAWRTTVDSFTHSNFFPGLANKNSKESAEINSNSNSNFTILNKRRKE